MRFFNEPQALEAVKGVEIVVTIHGQADTEEEFVVIGGLDTELESEIERELIGSGFQILEPPEKLKAIDPRNICNRGSC